MRGPNAEVGEIGREVDGDEGELEPADEKAGDEELIAAVTEGFAERRDDALVGLPRPTATAIGLPRMTIARKGTRSAMSAMTRSAVRHP